MFCGCAAPIAAAPRRAPSQLYWLKLRSSSVPTSVTTPIFRSLLPGAAFDGEGVGSALASPTGTQSPLAATVALALALPLPAAALLLPEFVPLQAARIRARMASIAIGAKLGDLRIKLLL